MEPVLHQHQYAAEYAGNQGGQQGFVCGNVQALAPGHAADPVDRIGAQLPDRRNAVDADHTQEKQHQDTNDKGHHGIYLLEAIGVAACIKLFIAYIPDRPCIILLEYLQIGALHTAVHAVLIHDHAHAEDCVLVAGPVLLCLGFRHDHGETGCLQGGYIVVDSTVILKFRVNGTAVQQQQLGVVRINPRYPKILIIRLGGLLFPAIHNISFIIPLVFVLDLIKADLISHPEAAAFVDQYIGQRILRIGNNRLSANQLGGVAFQQLVGIDQGLFYIQCQICIAIGQGNILDALHFFINFLFANVQGIGVKYNAIMFPEIGEGNKVGKAVNDCGYTDDGQKQNACHL